MVPLVFMSKAQALNKILCRGTSGAEEDRWKELHDGGICDGCKSECRRRLWQCLLSTVRLDETEMAHFTFLLVVTGRCSRRQAGLLELLFTSTLFTRLAVVQPTTTAIIQNLISLAIDKVEEDISNEW